MNFTVEQARKQSLTAEEFIRERFPAFAGKIIDAEFLSADRSRAVGFAGGLPWEAPICSHLLNDPAVGRFLEELEESAVIAAQKKNEEEPADGTGKASMSSDGSDEKPMPEEYVGRADSFADFSDIHLCMYTEAGRQDLPADVLAAAESIRARMEKSPGELNEKGELILDLKNYPVGPHYPVNLLLGNREGYPMPLVSTPKSALDALGRGSFRGVGAQQVLATRYVLQLEEAGEPANRQFYLVEEGKQIFYSADVKTNVKSAQCVHSQSRTVITYETECGLMIKRTIFILPQEEGMPGAVEAQRVEIANRSGRERNQKFLLITLFI